MLSKKFTAVAGAAAEVADDYFKNTTLLLSGDGTNGAQNNTFTDSSTNNFTITRNGNTTQGTFSPYTSAGSSWSNYFGGSSDYLTATNNTAYAFGTGDFCVESWVFLTSTPSGQMVVGSTYQSTSSGFTFSIESNVLKVRLLGDPVVVSGATTVTPNVWHHVAVTRSGTSLKVFLDGTQDGSVTNSDNVTLNSTAFNIGRLANGSGYLAGYMSNLRVVKGSAVYTSTFTPSTTPLTAITNTSLLTCQSNRYIDNSTNAFTITVGGTPSVQRFNPFNPTSAYSTSVVGGSGYFDGSGDYLTVASNSAFGFGTGDFTVECWVYPVSWVGASDGFISTLNSGTAVGVQISRDGVEVNGVLTTWGSSLSLNTWTHLALTRSGTSLKLFVNGAVSNTATNSANIGSSSALAIGRRLEDYNGYYCNAYISNARVVKGTAVYTSAFTPTTTPLTAISGTSLLANMTNAGIYDSAMMNDLETVGNAQISTSVKKYGTGSIAFDGNGDWLVAPDSVRNLFRFGTGDFTIEFWAWKSANGVNGYDGVIGSDNNGNAPGGFAVELSSNRGFVFYNDSNVRISYAMNPNDSTWHHYACVRSNGTMALYKDGTQLTTATYTGDLGCNVVVRVGTLGTTSNFNGYIDDLRVTRGYARYTATFTPPTAALPNY